MLGPFYLMLDDRHRSWFACPSRLLIEQLTIVPARTVTAAVVTRRVTEQNDQSTGCHGTVAPGENDMTTTSDIRIIGLDPARAPRIRKESYIDLYFELSEKASKEWCEDFNVIGRRINPSPKIDSAKGQFIETYVNNMDQIAPHLNVVKKAVSECNTQYQQKLQQRALDLLASKANLQGQGGEQNRLNLIISTLDFDS